MHVLNVKEVDVSRICACVAACVFVAGGALASLPPRDMLAPLAQQYLGGQACVESSHGKNAKRHLHNQSASRVLRILVVSSMGPRIGMAVKRRTILDRTSQVKSS